jgi:uncharacterized membrane protein
MATVEKKIEVEVPVQTAYNQWTQFEEFPRFMEGVKEVHQIDSSRIHWVAEIGGERKEWDARITRQVPDKMIAWESEGGTVNSGVVTFRPSEMNTEVQLHMEYEPEDTKEKAGDVLGFVSRKVDSDLKRFKEFIETRGTETGAWRGEIPAGREGGTGSMESTMGRDSTYSTERMGSRGTEEPGRQPGFGNPETGPTA